MTPNIRYTSWGFSCNDGSYVAISYGGLIYPGHPYPGQGVFHRGLKVSPRAEKESKEDFSARALRGYKLLLLIQ